MAVDINSNTKRLNENNLAQKGVLLVNLGSPEKPETKAIRKFLREFLSDHRVLDIPFWARWLILRLFILPFRPGKIKERYQKIWDGARFPLLKHGYELAGKVSRMLGEDYQVELAMRYGSLSIESGLDRLRQSGINEIIVLPLFPQYSSATTGSILEKVFEIIKQWDVIPAISTITSFYNHPGFIKACVDNGKKYLEMEPDHILFSFHGVPERHLLKSDLSGEHCLKVEDCCGRITSGNKTCYRAQCFNTAKLVAQGLDIQEKDYTVCFQSRLGKTPWLQPYTNSTVKELAQGDVKFLLVFCLSFVADCLETTEEILERETDNFLRNGGDRLDLVPSLNGNDEWARVITSMIINKS